MGPCALGLAGAPHALRLSHASPHAQAVGHHLGFSALPPVGPDRGWQVLVLG